MNFATNDRRGVYKSSIGRVGIPIGNLPADVESFKLVKNGDLFYTDATGKTQQGSKLLYFTESDLLNSINQLHLA